MKRLILACAGTWLLFCWNFSNTLAAELTVQARVRPERAILGEQLTLTIETAGAQRVAAPNVAVDGFAVRHIGPTTQISVVNGKVRSTVSHRYSLTPNQTGEFNLGPFEVNHKGERYRTEAVAVSILTPEKGLEKRRASPHSGLTMGQDIASKETVFLRISGPENAVYKNQRFSIDVTLYVTAARISDVEYPKVLQDGFLMESFAKPLQDEQILNGKRYTSLTFRADVTPLRPGQLELGPAVLTLNVLTRKRNNSRFSDPFFGGFFQNDFFSGLSSERKQRRLRSEPLSLSVLPLPEEGKPAGFSGAVGSFALDVHASPLELSVGDPVTVTTRIHGAGNLAAATWSGISESTGFRTYEPIAGKATREDKQFEQVLIPQNTSSNVVPAVRFSYFDPEVRGYKTLKSKLIPLTIHPSDTAAKGTIFWTKEETEQSVLSEETLGNDIIYIKSEIGWVSESTAPWYGSVGFILYHTLPLIFVAGAWWYDRRRTRWREDSSFARFTSAGKEARISLVDADKQLLAKVDQVLYTRLAHTLQEYLSAKLGLEPGGFAPDKLDQVGLSEGRVEQIRLVWERCERFRFGRASAVTMRAKGRETVSIITEIVDYFEREHRQYKNRTARKSMIVGAVLGLACTSALIGLDVAMAAPTVETAYLKGNELYAQGDYEGAVKEYHTILATGAVSGNIYFNLGNAYFKQGDLGQAIANYERASWFSPSDRDLVANLEYVRSLAGARSCNAPPWWQLMFPLAQLFPKRVLLWLASGLYTLLLALCGIYYLLPYRPAWLFRASVCAALALLLVGASLVEHLRVEEFQWHAVVVAGPGGSIRYGPTNDGTVHFSVVQGDMLKVSDREAGWSQVSRCDGKRGWIETSALEDL